MPSKHILIVEDNIQLLRLYTRALDSAGYITHSVTTSREAADSLDSWHYDLLISDLQVSDGHTLDLLEAVLPNLHARGTQVVIVSGKDQYREDCEALGVQHFIPKPLPPADLLAVVDALLRPASV